MRWLLLLALCACSPPRRIVVLDKELKVTTEEAVYEMESALVCDIWDRPTMDSGFLDKVGPLPSFDTITVELDPSIDHGGMATVGVSNRCRVRIRDADASGPLVAHEMLHCMGEEHQESGIMDKTVHSDWWTVFFMTTNEYMERLVRRYCR